MLFEWFSLMFSTRCIASHRRKYVILSLFLHACFDTLVLAIQYPKTHFYVSFIPPMNIRSTVFILVQYEKLRFFPPFLPPHLHVYLLYACLMSSNMTISQYKHHICHPCTYAILFMCRLLHGCVLSCISHFSPSFVSHLHVLCCCYRVYRHDENLKSLPDINKHCIDDSFIWW